MQIFLLNAYVFRDFLIFRLNFQRFFLHCVIHPEVRKVQFHQELPNMVECSLVATALSVQVYKNDSLIGMQEFLNMV
jgi:hypothetical protein